MTYAIFNRDHLTYEMGDYCRTFDGKTGKIVRRYKEACKGLEVDLEQPDGSIITVREAHIVEVSNHAFND